MLGAVLATEEPDMSPREVGERGTETERDGQRQNREGEIHSQASTLLNARTKVCNKCCSWPLAYLGQGRGMVGSGQGTSENLPGGKGIGVES